MEQNSDDTRPTLCNADHVLRRNPELRERSDEGIKKKKTSFRKKVRRTLDGLHTHIRNDLVRVRELFLSSLAANALRSMFQLSITILSVARFPYSYPKTALHTRRYHPADARRQFLVPPRRHENILAPHHILSDKVCIALHRIMQWSSSSL